jgi:hypothetical protein
MPWLFFEVAVVWVLHFSCYQCHFHCDFNCYRYLCSNIEAEGEVRKQIQWFEEPTTAYRQ